MSRSNIELKLSPAHLRGFARLINDLRVTGDSAVIWLRRRGYRRISRSAVYRYMRRRRPMTLAKFHLINASRDRLRQIIRQAAQELRGGELHSLASYAAFLASGSMPAPTNAIAARRHETASPKRRR